MRELSEEIKLRVRTRKLLDPIFMRIEDVLKGEQSTTITISSDFSANAFNSDLSGQLNPPELLAASVWRDIVGEIEIPSARLLISQRTILLHIDKEKVIVRVADNWMSMVKRREEHLMLALRKRLGSAIQLIFECTVDDGINIEDEDISKKGTHKLQFSAERPLDTQAKKSSLRHDTSKVINNKRFNDHIDHLIEPTSICEDLRSANKLIHEVKRLNHLNMKEVLMALGCCSGIEGLPQDEKVNQLYHSLVDAIIRKASACPGNYATSSVRSRVSRTQKSTEMGTDGNSLLALRGLSKRQLLAYCQGVGIAASELKSICEEVGNVLAGKAFSSANFMDLQNEIKAAKKEIGILENKLKRAATVAEKLKIKLKEERSKRGRVSSALDKPYRLPYTIV